MTESNDDNLAAQDNSGVKGASIIIGEPPDNTGPPPLQCVAIFNGDEIRSDGTTQSAADDGLEEIKAKVFRKSYTPKPAPPPDAVSGQVMGGSMWQFSGVPGAQSGKDNKLVVWGYFAVSGWVKAPREFYGC